MAQDDTVSRRRFLETSSRALGAAAALPALPALAGTAALPRRVLGRTGVPVSILAFGCGSRFLMYEDLDDSLTVLNRAIDSGINYLDTAVSYGDGKSETRVGMVMKTRRKEVFLATKMPNRARTRDTALREFEASLKRLQTDRVDLLHIHNVGDDADLAQIESEDGVLKALYEMREQKAARFIGMTSHTDGAVMAKAIDRDDIDCVQLAMNPARAGRLEELALPAARRKNLGILLMKVTAQEKLLGAGGADTAALLRYAWSLPVASVVCGMPKPGHLTENLAGARAFAPMAPAEMDGLRQQLAGHKVALERFFAHHHDGHVA
jgi:aryl-alcohol dehydrogenase-like predicted oxidoreductase